MYVSQISPHDTFAGYRIVICKNHADALREARKMLNEYTPESVETYTFTLKQVFSTIGATPHYANFEGTGVQHLGRLLAYSSDALRYDLIDMMVRIASYRSIRGKLP